jgi:predicted dehydrogenase
MIRLGFLGAQSSHARIFGRLINVERRYDGLCVSAIWRGDCPDAKEEIADELHIKTIAATEKALIEDSDAVVILLRDGGSHAQWARLALQLGKPLFIDKPFTYSPEDALEILRTAQKLNVPVFGGSALRHLPAIGEIRRRITEEKSCRLAIRFCADPDSPFGGYHFYGCHLADLAVAMLGSRYTCVLAARQGRCVTVQVKHDDAQVLLLSNPDTEGLSISFNSGEAAPDAIPYEACYGLALEQFSLMLKTGVLPVPYDELAATVALTSEIVSQLDI